ncbi:MAG: 50S ribosomal protein L5, partial [Acidimicrobiales bacterium]
MATATTQMPRLKARYYETIRDQLKADLGLGNVMQVPKVDKISINMGVGDAVNQARLLDGAVEDLTIIAGQKPVVTRAKKSIAGF